MAIIRLDHVIGCPAIQAWDIPGACNCGGPVWWCDVCGLECEPGGDRLCIDENGYSCSECGDYVSEKGLRLA